MEIVLLRLDRIGDFILGIPSYRALRQAYPKDLISVIVPSFVAELAEACPYFDEVYVFEALWLFSAILHAAVGVGVETDQVLAFQKNRDAL